jgi:hypothetical protein
MLFHDATVGPRLFRNGIVGDRTTCGLGRFRNAYDGVDVTLRRFWNDRVLMMFRDSTTGQCC